MLWANVLSLCVCGMICTAEVSRTLQIFYNVPLTSSWPSMCEAKPLKFVRLPVTRVIYPRSRPLLDYQRGLRLSNPISLTLSLAFPLIRTVDRVNPMLNFKNQHEDQQLAAMQFTLRPSWMQNSTFKMAARSIVGWNNLTEM